MERPASEGLLLGRGREGFQDRLMTTFGALLQFCDLLSYCREFLVDYIVQLEMEEWKRKSKNKVITHHEMKLFIH